MTSQLVIFGAFFLSFFRPPTLNMKKKIQKKFWPYKDNPSDNGDLLIQYPAHPSIYPLWEGGN